MEEAFISYLEDALEKNSTEEKVEELVFNENSKKLKIVVLLVF